MSIRSEIVTAANALLEALGEEPRGERETFVQFMERVAEAAAAESAGACVEVPYAHPEAGSGSITYDPELIDGVHIEFDGRYVIATPILPTTGET